MIRETTRAPASARRFALAAVLELTLKRFWLDWVAVGT